MCTVKFLNFHDWKAIGAKSIADVVLHKSWGVSSERQDQVGAAGPLPKSPTGSTAPRTSLAATPVPVRASSTRLLGARRCTIVTRPLSS